MKLKKKVKTLEEVAEAFRGLYTKQGDEYVLEVEADDGGGDLAKELATERARVKEFRENNIALTESLKKFKDIDPEKYAEARQALEAVNKLEEADLIKSGKLDEVVERRLAAHKRQVEKERTDNATRIKALETEANDFRTKYSGLLVDTKVSETISGVGQLRKGALADVLNRARSVWKANEKGELVADNLYDTDGKPMTMEGYTKQLLQEAPYLFEPGAGSGGGGGAKNKGRQEGGPRVINNDPVEFGKNLADIASGKVTVRGFEAATTE